MPLCDLAISHNCLPSGRNLPLVFLGEFAPDGKSPTRASCKQDNLSLAENFFVRNSVVRKPAEIASPPFAQVLDAAELVPKSVDESVIRRHQRANSAYVVRIDAIQERKYNFNRFFVFHARFSLGSRV